MAVLEEWTPDLEYIAVRVPDKMLIASILTEARGQRTMAQLAESCGVSASTLSRAVNGKITKPMTVELIKSISMNADPPNHRLFERLVRANGLVPKDVYDRTSKSPDMDRRQQRRDDETKARNIIMTELMKRGVPVKLVSYQSRPIETDFMLTLPSDFLIETDLGDGPLLWSFEVVPYKMEDTIDDNRIPLRFYTRNTMHNMSGWFLADAWEPEKLEGRLHTFLFLDGTFYTMFEDHLIGPEVNNDFSFVTLDLEAEKVNFEIYMIRKDNHQHELIFTRPVIDTGSGDEDDDPWGISPEHDAFGHKEDNE